MTQHVNESIEVTALFTHAGLRPYGMKWGGRRYEPLQIHLSHTVHEGRKRWHVFACSDPANVFTLAFDPEALRWQLWEVG